MQTEKSENKIEIILIGISLLAIIVMYGTDILRICDWKIPNEIREGANVALIDAFANGNNPFRSLIAPNGDPNVYYMYPLLNNLLAALIVKVTALPAGLIALLLNLIYTTLASALVARITKFYINNRYLIVLSFLMSHYCGWRYTNVSAFPDMLAVVFLLVIMYLCTVRTGKIGIKEIFYLSILTILSFYTKQYAVVVGLPVVIYLWLQEGKKKSFIYFGFTAVLGVASVIIIYFTMPFYFVETLLLVGNSADNDFGWAITQFIKMGKLFFPWFLAVMIWLVFDRKKTKKIDYVIINFFTAIVMLIYFGQNTGAHLSYHLQLWLPSIIIYSSS